MPPSVLWAFSAERGGSGPDKGPSQPAVGSPGDRSHAQAERGAHANLAGPPVSRSDSWPPASRAIDLSEYQRLLADEPFPSLAPESLTWEAGGDRIVVIAWGCAVLWQLAHPVIARAVAAHSELDTTAQGRWRHYEHTRRAHLALVFGDPHTAWTMAQHIDAIHGRIHGTTVIHGITRRYSARDPELLAWVHATLVGSALLVYRRFVRPIGTTEANRYLAQASTLGPLLGVSRERFPARLDQLERLWRRMESEALTVTEEARIIVGKLRPGLPVPMIGPMINAFGRQMVVGLLPPWLRRAYGLPWGPVRSAFFQTMAGASRRLYRRLPERLRRWPDAPQRGSAP